MKPIGTLVFVRPDPVKEAFKTDLIEIPDIVSERQRLEVTTGIIDSISPWAWLQVGDGTPQAAVGDHVVYAKHGGKLFKHPETGVELLMLLDRDVLGVI